MLGVGGHSPESVFKLSVAFSKCHLSQKPVTDEMFFWGKYSDIFFSVASPQAFRNNMMLLSIVFRNIVGASVDYRKVPFSILVNNKHKNLLNINRNDIFIYQRFLTIGDF